MLLVLTTSGLGLYDFDKPWWERQVRCPSGSNDSDPVIIPYRDLAPFLNPGPLRDELLKQ